MSPETDDSHEQRTVSIEISYDSDYSGKHWTEWEEIHSCNQLGLSNGQTPVLEGLKNRTVADNCMSSMSGDATVLDIIRNNSIYKGSIKSMSDKKQSDT